MKNSVSEIISTRHLTNLMRILRNFRQRKKSQISNLKFQGNTKTFQPTMRIDTKLLNETESSDGTQTKEEVAQGLRLKVSAVGKTAWKGEANRPARR